ncbi:MAG: translation initiation factor IF-2 [Candidatus Puniceispirillaceae bacterium]
MKVKVQWIIDGVMEVDADSNEEAEALVDEKLRGFIVSNPELTDVLGASAIQGHAITEDEAK